MKMFAIGLTASAAMMTFAGSAVADGYVRNVPVVTARCASFSGFYIGGSVGAVQYDPKLEDRDGLLSLNVRQATTFIGSDDAFAGGPQAGYNFQRGCTLFGIEGDWNWTDARVSSHLFPNVAGVRDISTSATLNSFGTLRTRSGVIVDNALLYVTGGLAWLDVRHNLHSNTLADNERFSFSDTPLGWTAGVGFEYALSSNISIKSETLYMTTSDEVHRIHTNPVFNLCQTVASTCDFRTNESAWVARMGLNIRFGSSLDYAPLK
jgi:outer membrane immunogenic protein